MTAPTISTYDELGAAIQEWLSEDSLLSSRWPDLVAFCEAELNYGRGREIPPLRVLDMQRAQFTTILPEEEGGTEENITLPEDYLEMRALNEITNPYNGALEAITPDEFYTKQLQGPWNRMKYYSIIGGQIRVQDAAKEDDQLEMNYYARIPALSSSNQSNWLLAKHPQLYLYGSLIHAEPFLDNDPRVTTWQGLYDQHRAGVIEADRRAQSSLGPRRKQVAKSVAVY